jgi:hypothetical protein
MAKTQHKRKVNRKRKAKGTNRKSVNNVPLGLPRRNAKKMSPTQHLKNLLNIPPNFYKPPPSAAPLHSLSSSTSTSRSSSSSPYKIDVSATKEMQKFLRQTGVTFTGKKKKKARGKRRKSKGRKSKGRKSKGRK